MASSSAGYGSGTYVDPWQEYRVIASKLRKRFLRKPNISEACREFNALANRMAEEECGHYAALCKLAAARCHHQLGNPSAECADLTEAARMFLECERWKHDTSSPGFSNNLNSAIHCYGHAVKTLAEQKCFNQAGNLCLELGLKLINLDRPYEATDYFDKALKFYRNQPLDELHALQWLCVARILNLEFRSALNILDKTEDHILSKYLRSAQASQTLPFVLSKQTENDYFKHLLVDVEILQLLLICLISPESDHGLTEREKRLWHKYFPDDSLEFSSSSKVDNLNSEGRLDESQFMLLQSFVTALQRKDFDSAQVCLTDLRPYLKHVVFDLALIAYESRRLDYLTNL